MRSNLKIRGTIVSTIVLFFLSDYDCVGQKKNEVLLDSLAQQGPTWEVGVYGGTSKFIGTLNLYSSDLFSLYRGDGNDFALSFGATVDRKFSKYFSYGLYLSYAQLKGVVTYVGEPTQVMEYLLKMPYGAKGAFETQVFSALPTFSIELVEVYNRLLSFKSMSLSQLRFTIGIGMSKTKIIDPAFKNSEYYYDFSQNEDIEYTAMLALRYQRILNERFSLSCGVHYLLVNGARLDGYFVNSEDQFEGIPSGSKDGAPSTADTYLSIQLGVVLRLNKS